jgi:CubicO group peptidase (beta-lactamase class C family)
MTVLAHPDGRQSEIAPAERPVTIWNLLTHTSGLSNNKAYEAAGIFERSLPLREAVDRLASIPLAHQPGAAWQYGASMEVLGRLVEVWSGQPFDEFLRRRLFQPLAMKDTDFFVPESKLGRLAVLYTKTAPGNIEPLRGMEDPARRPVYLSGGGGLYSTVDDYLNFCRMLLGGGLFEGKRILAAQTVDLMMENQLPSAVIPKQGPNDRKGYGYGLGGAVLVDPSSAAVPGGLGEYTWGGNWGTMFWVDRARDVAGVWFVQRYPFEFPAALRFKAMAYGALKVQPR